MKIFCIGANKTGTTSLYHEFERLGYRVGNQIVAERLLKEYSENNFDKIIEYCQTADFFQDIPFSLPNTFKHLDKAYPNSKFILTIRNSPEEWYESLVRFHSGIYGKNGNIPTAEDLKNATYRWKGWMWETNRILFNTPETNPYQKDLVIKSYVDYNNSVLDYFKDRADLLVLNLAETGSYDKFTSFLGKQSMFDNFLHLNKSK
jgi:hypothetical protein